MHTKQWTIDDLEHHKEDIAEAAALLQAGELVVFPTETVYGLGADATNEQAVAKIFAAKGRPQDNPLIVHAASKEQLRSLAAYLPDYAEKLIDRFSPGPLTYVLPENGRCARNVTAGLQTVGIRIPDHPAAIALIKAAGLPLAAPSANISGKPSPTAASHAAEDLAGKIAGILDGGPTGVGVESTVIDCTGDLPVILRPGAVTEEMIAETIGQRLASTDALSETEKPKAPGMKYRHYAPEVPLWLVNGKPGQLQELISQQQKQGLRVAVMASSGTLTELHADGQFSLGGNLQETAAHLYDGLRRFEAGDADLIICEAFPETGLGVAIMNRLKKAASKYIEL